MAHTAHEESMADLDKAYEPNVIGIKGIIYFGIGLFLLIVITFALMYALFWGVLEQDALAKKSSDNPLKMSDTERLPPEPRLQSAPGFGVTGPAGRVNLELREPQAEYRELKKIWDELRENGRVDAATGTVVAIPIDAAIDKLLARTEGKTTPGTDAAKEAVKPETDSPEPKPSENEHQ